MADNSSSVRAKQSTSANFKAHCHTDKGKREIRGFLDGVLSLQRSFDAEKQEWCLWLIAGGRPPEEFYSALTTHRQYAVWFGTKTLLRTDVGTAESLLVCLCVRIVFMPEITKDTTLTCLRVGAIAEYPAHQMSYLKKLPTRSAVPKSINEKKSVKG